MLLQIVSQIKIRLIHPHRFQLWIVVLKDIHEDLIRRRHTFETFLYFSKFEGKTIKSGQSLCATKVGIADLTPNLRAT